jgi:hypothetical protein
MVDFPTSYIPRLSAGYSLAYVWILPQHLASRQRSHVVDVACRQDQSQGTGQSVRWPHRFRALLPRGALNGCRHTLSRFPIEQRMLHHQRETWKAPSVPPAC